MSEESGVNCLLDLSADLCTDERCTCRVLSAYSGTTFGKSSRASCLSCERGIRLLNQKKTKRAKGRRDESGRQKVRDV